MQELFKDLYDEWFANSNYWFSKTVENDKYLSDKYFSKLYTDTNIINCLKHCDKRTIMGAIIAFDQIPRHYNRLCPIDCSTYSHIAKDISSILIINGDVSIIEEMTSTDWCFAFLPFRHLKDIKCINSSIEFINFKFKSAQNKPSDKAIYKRFLRCAIRDVYKTNTKQQLETQQNKNISDNQSNWDLFKDILENNPFDKLSTNIENYPEKDIIKNIYNVSNFININMHIIVSVSGGVDSFVCLHMLKLIFPNYKITAVHINYNNRKECDKEVEFVKAYCDLLKVKLYHRKIIELKRNDCQNNGLRALYEDATKEIRFDTYRQVAKIYDNQSFVVVLGHNKDDCFENIITNISMKTNYENLCGMSKHTVNDNICFVRPLLDVRKKDIIKYANCMNIPYLQDSTPKWSMRGKIRDCVLPNMEKINVDITGSFFALKGRIEEIENVIDKYVLPNTLKHFVVEKDKMFGKFKIDELLEEGNIWSKVFEHETFRKFLSCNVSHKCICEFSELIIRFKKDYARMREKNIFNSKIKFIIRKHVHSVIYRTKDDMICICFCKNTED